MEDNCIEEYLSNRSWRKSESLAYLAGFIDGEGCLSLTRHRFRNKGNDRYYEYFKPVIRIANTHKDTMLFIGSVLTKIGINFTTFLQTKNRDTPIHYISIRQKESMIKLIELISPFLVTKEKQAKVFLQYFYLNDNHVNKLSLNLSKELSGLNTKNKFGRTKYDQ